MKGLEWFLSGQGYRVLNMDYPSRRLPVARLSEESLHPFLLANLTDPAVQVHFVTHSLGGILLRQYLSTHKLANLGRAVMFAPPNQGSELADRLRFSVIHRTLLGPSMLQLGTDSESLPQHLGPVVFELGVIAGDRSLNPLFAQQLPLPNDGKVSVASTQVAGMKDFVVVHRSHTWIMWDREMLRQTACFLANGSFRTRPGW